VGQNTSDTLDSYHLPLIVLLSSWRGVWAANKGLLKGVVHPSARVYRSVLPQPVRKSIQNFERNITYPGRVVNNLLQGRWSGAGQETTRFLSNSTVGLGGLFDPATQWNIEKSDASFSQTFGKWGWRPKTYMVLPLFGPSDERNTLGLLADRAATPLNYANQPYLSATYLTTYNQLAATSETAQQLLEIEADSYSIVKYAWSHGSKYEKPDTTQRGEVDIPTLQTLAAVLITPENENFLASNREIKVKIPTTGRKLKFNYWLQPDSAPLVYILPGLNAHRLSNLSLALAEHLYEQGFSVVSTSSVFHPEFMENASTAHLPIYLPVDSKDLLVALTELMTFDRYVAINSPVDMVYSAKLVDQFIHSPMAWPEAQRQDRINNTIHKATANGIISKRTGPPLTFDQIESEYLVGLAFRFGLRDLIYSSQIRNNQGVLQTPISKWRREPAYHEIMNYSYHDYFYKFTVPYYKAKGVDATELLRHANLRNKESKLRKQSKIHVLTNRNDFMLPEKDLRWLKKTFPSSRLKVFPQGGHLGNLNSPDVEEAIIEALKGLKR